ncbi:hypothetical protein A3Q56_02554 [Intoshia linei]|uniref:Uncharacterized protein n=1 Tax=Intoshia linei TaxID=1819745 RepID=A0A177B5U9_9BILA|nr:hypothetical protein A3Q56_02554 [Intoshia linei]
MFRINKITRKKKIKKINSRNYDVFGQDVQKLNNPSKIVFVNTSLELDQSKSWRRNRPNPQRSSFIRSNARTLCKPICYVTTKKNEQNENLFYEIQTNDNYSNILPKKIIDSDKITSTQRSDFIKPHLDLNQHSKFPRLEVSSDGYLVEMRSFEHEINNKLNHYGPPKGNVIIFYTVNSKESFRLNLFLNIKNLEARMLHLES